MSSSSPTQDLSSDPRSESGNTSSSSFSSLLGDNPPLNTNQVPIVNIPDSEETESDSEGLSDGGRNIPPPKIYKTFLTETYNNNSEYTSLSAIERFRKSTPVANLTVPIVKFDQLSFDEKIDVAFLRNQAPIDCGFLLENEDLPSRLRQSLDKMPPKTSVPQVITNEKALRRWLKKVGVDPSAPNSEIQTTVPANERRKKQKLDTSRGNQQQQTKTVGNAMGTNLDVPPAKTTEGED
ncbi:glycosyl hydrolase [Sesbania bispinosa]|nr:glycosyl hydrolase [Sesbania bispinosa]